MIVLRLALALALLGSPAIAEDAASSSSFAPWSAMSSSLEPLPPEPSSTPAPAPAPAGSLTDAELEMAVRAAYSAAASFATAHGNYFTRDGIVPPLRDAVAAAVSAAYPSVGVPADAFADLDASKVCLTAPGTELRIAANLYGDGIALAAVTDARVFAYDYDPHKSPDIKVLPAADCIKPK